MPQKLPLLARQPIFDRQMQVVAYELLYRADQQNRAQFADGDSASTQVLLNTFAELSIKQVVGQRRAFINFTAELMHTQLPFDTSQLVIEVLETEIINSALLHRLKQLREDGFAIALDDFELTAQSEALLPYADIVKLDVLALSDSALRAHVQQLKPLGIELLAEKIETFEMLEHCRTLGFSMFQGYFLERPQVITGQRLTQSRQAVLQLLAQLNNPEAAFEDIEITLSRDPVLSYKLLRLVNSAAFGLPRTIESLRQALTLLGLTIIRNWIGLLAMSKLGDKPAELSVKALTRAKMCELMAAHTRPRHECDTFFTAGLLSTLGAFMDMPLSQALADIHLSRALCQALLEYAGPEGEVLQSVIHYEHGQWEKINWAFLQTLQLDPHSLSAVYLETLAWVDETITQLQ
jgi:EAL and modified HD-GYP domain-containing signal transduction protein